MGKLPDLKAYSKKFGKPDLERLGFFIEMPYLPARGKPGKSAKGKGETLRTMLPGGPKTKCGNMDGYFDTTFYRMWQGEGPGRPRGSLRKEKEVTPFIPTGPAKHHATPGDYFGCFNEYTAFNPKARKEPKYKPPPPNCITNPSKKGGPGYIDITIGKYPEYKGGKQKAKPKPTKPLALAGPMITNTFPQPYFPPNPYVDLSGKRLYIKPKAKPVDKKLAGRPTFIPTGPSKWSGGCKGGTFEKWPEWKKDKWLTPQEQEKKLLGKKVPKRGEFYPQSYGFKTTNVFSSLHNTDYSVNATNFKTYETTYVKRLLKTVY